MISITTRLWCQRAMQHGGGKTVAIDAYRLERAQCDSQCIGSLEADEPEAPCRTSHRGCVGSFTSAMAIAVSPALAFIQVSDQPSIEMTMSEDLAVFCP